jgi:hypothetical protein
MTEREDPELIRFGAELARSERLHAPDALRTQLRAALLAAPVPARAAPIGLRASWLRPALAAFAALAIIAATGGYAAAGSLPGDGAFGLKRAAEEAQTALTPSDAARLEQRVTQSDRRVTELLEVAASRPMALAIATDEYLAAVTRVDEALAFVLNQPQTAERDAAVARANSSSTDHIAVLLSLAQRVPVQAQPGIQRAIDAQNSVKGSSGNGPGRPSTPPGTSGSPAQTAPVPTGRPSQPPTAPAQGSPASPPRGGPPSSVPGRP